MIGAAWALVDRHRGPVEVTCLDCGYYFTLPLEEARTARFCPQCGKAPLSCLDAQLEPE